MSKEKNGNEPESDDENLDGNAKRQDLCVVICSERELRSVD